MISSRHVWTIHPILHVARTGRALPAYDASAKFAAPVQHRPDNSDRRRENSGYRPRACPDALGPHSGLVEKTAKEAPSTFNARAETVGEKPMFRSAFKRTRCIVPASGYYEWWPSEGAKQPYFTSAGLWDQWKDPETGEAI